MNKRMVRRVFSLLLAVMLTVAAFPAAFAEGESGQAQDLGVQAEFLPETPVEEPEEPVAEPETPAENPEAPAEEPETPVEEPVEEPETPVEEPVEEPETPVEPETEPEAEALPCAKTEGCTLEDGHEGDCVLEEPEAEAPETLPEQLAALSETGGALRYEEDYTLDADLTVPAGVELTVAGKLTVPAGFTLTNNATLNLFGVTDVYGTLVNAENASIEIHVDTERYPDAAYALTLFAGDGQAAALQNNGAISLFGTLVVQEGATLSGAANITLNEGASITGKTDLIEETPLPYGFAGMPEGYVLSDAQLAAKAQLVEHGVVAQTASLTPGADYVENEILYLAESEELAGQIAAAYSAELTSYGAELAVATLTTATTLEAVTAAADPNIPLPAVSPNHTVSIGPDVSEPLADAEAEVSAFSLEAPTKKAWDDYKLGDPMLGDPSDPNSYQWMHDMVNSYEAWGVTTGDASVKVAVLDSGVKADHVDFSGRVTPVTFDGGYSSTGDDDGHGTHVAGIIAATLGNDAGGSGIAPGVSILSVRVLDEEGHGTDVTTGRGIEAAVAAGADIINMSLGGIAYNPEIQTKINEAVAAGVTVIAAMGNDGSNTVFYPAAYDNVIAVAAVNRDGQRAGFSNYGAWADIAAPGVDLLSTYNDGDYYLMSGTSQATPVVAGVAALYMSKVGHVSPAEMEKKLKASVNRAASSEVGAGIIDASKLFATDKVKPVITVLDKNGKAITNLKVALPSDVTFTVTGGAGSTNDEFLLYTLDGKTPTVKDGEVIIGEEYPQAGPVSLAAYAGKSVTIKAICVSGMGVSSAVASLTIKLAAGQPSVTDVSILRTDGNLEDAIPASRSAQFAASVSPEDALPKITWSIVEKPVGSKAAISANGLLTTQYTDAGTVKIRATSVSNPTVFEEVEVTVTAYVKEKIKSIKLEPSVKLNLPVQSGDPAAIAITELFDINDTDVKGYADAYVKSWTSSNVKVVRVDPVTGAITAVGKGSTTVTCKMLDGSGKSARCAVTVTQLVTDMAVTGQMSIAPGKYATYKANVLPANANNKAVTWSIGGTDAAVASVTTGGKVTVSGSATNGQQFMVIATAKDGSGKSASCDVTVIPLAKSVAIAPEDPEDARVTKNSAGVMTGATLDVQNGVGDAIKLVSHVYLDDAKTDERSGVEPLWTSSNTRIATVTPLPNGEVTVSAVAPGKSTVTCAANDGSGKKASVTITVVLPMLSFDIAGMDYIAPGKSATYKLADIQPAKPTNAAVEWSIDNDPVPTGVSISSRGVLMVRADADVSEGGIITVRATGKDANAAGNTKDVTVQPLVTLVTLTTMNVPMDDPRLTVQNGSVTAAKLDKAETLVLRAATSPSTAPVTWKSSNARIATVEVDHDDNAVVRTVAPGKATITCSATDMSGKKATVAVTVVEAVTGLAITGQPYIAKGRSATYKATAFAPASATEKAVDWSIDSDPVPAGVSINSRGVLTLKADAEVDNGDVITVRATAKDKGGAHETCTVTVVDALTASVKIDSADTRAEYSRNVMKSATIFSVDMPWSDFDETEKDSFTETEIVLESTGVGNGTDLLWTSSNEKVATVEDNLNGTATVTGIAAGKTTITCAAQDGSGKKASVTITVIVPVSYLTVAGKNAGNTIGIGKSISHTVAFGDSYGTPSVKKVRWICQVFKSGAPASTSNITISSSGVLTVKPAFIYEYNELAAERKTCRVVVYAIATDGSGTYSSTGYQVYPVGTTVRALSSGGTYIPQRLVWLPFESDCPYISRTVNGTTQVFSGFTVTSSNPKVACFAGDSDSYRIRYNGRNFIAPIATGVVPGTARITVKATDGSNRSCTFTIKVVQPVTGIEVTGPSTIAPGRYASYKATITPSNASNKSIGWYSEGELPEGVTLTTAGRVTVAKTVPSGTTFRIIAYSKDYYSDWLDSDPFEITVG